jgi:hypothetical protein
MPVVSPASTEVGVADTDTVMGVTTVTVAEELALPPGPVTVRV